MRIQPIITDYQPNFCAMKMRQIKTKPRISPEDEQNKNYMHAIGFALAFIAASFTMYIVDLFKTKDKKPAATEMPAPNQIQQQNTFQAE